MTMFLWGLGLFILNTLVGACVWTAIDKNGDLFRWYEKAPGSLLKVAVLNAWPAGLWFCGYRRQYGPDHTRG